MTFRTPAINQVIRYQRWLNLLILAVIGFEILRYALVASPLAERAPTSEPPIPMIFLAARLALSLLAVALVINLLRALGRGAVTLVAAGVALFLPLINLIVIFYASRAATRVLRERGYRVGFLGARDPRADPA